MFRGAHGHAKSLDAEDIPVSLGQQRGSLSVVCCWISGSLLLHDSAGSKVRD